MKPHGVLFARVLWFCFTTRLSLSSEYEDRELRIARERDRKRMEFTNQLQRINNQLEYEKSRDTQGNVFEVAMNILIIYMMTYLHFHASPMIWNGNFDGVNKTSFCFMNSF